MLNMNKVAECREKSQSAWLHFPHVELVFLFFAFEGAVASQVSAIRENDSPAVFSLAMASLVSRLTFATCHALALRCVEVIMAITAVDPVAHGVEAPRGCRAIAGACTTRQNFECQHLALLSTVGFLFPAPPCVCIATTPRPSYTNEPECGSQCHRLLFQYLPRYMFFSRCPTFVPAVCFPPSWVSCVQLLYPVLMIVMVSRTFAAKVRTADHIVFKPIADDAGDESGGTFFSGTRSFGVKVRTSLKEDHSMFAWADKGQWKSVETSDRGVQQERDWFRIGFEPIFVDFTDKGSWFVVYTLIEVRALRLASL